jgi:hypothetical protein
MQHANICANAGFGTHSGRAVELAFIFQRLVIVLHCCLQLAHVLCMQMCKSVLAQTLLKRET